MAILKKPFLVLFGPRKKKPAWQLEWENQRLRSPLEWTNDQADTYRWLTSIEHDQRKHKWKEPGAIGLQPEKETPELGRALMKILVRQIQSADQTLFELGAIVISPDGEIAQGNELVTLLMVSRDSDPLRPPGPRSWH
jgi:hypothetical protein